MIIKVCETKKDILDHLKVRTQVFIIEQHVSWEIEFDFLDEVATLFVAYDESENPIGAGRVRLLDEGIAKVERIAVMQKARQSGVGKALMETIENYVLTHTPIRDFKLSAQLHAIAFYEKLGYAAYGPIYLDANIEHRDMKKHV